MPDEAFINAVPAYKAYCMHSDFVIESNKIEGILREPTQREINEHIRFVGLDEVTIDDLIQFVSVYQPDAKLRDKKGLDVRVGDYTPLSGGEDVREELIQCLVLGVMEKESPYKIHQEYERLHPFTDCNGRSGRVLWAWQMKEYPLGFLHHYYYQSLE